MRKFLYPTIVAAMLATSVGAFAADTTTTDAIKAFDMKAMTLTLQDGSVYYLPKGFKDPGLKVGEKVNVTWHMTSDKHEVDTVTIAK
ncbi:hypothetical protein DEA8626_00355 [Defluviimonas aquaemixtae]|uniref:DUF1344 domain-containing protein n=1 Tax=Albidovulum aquaemixtae TaxID=1542388 RepID=A0A2R8B2J3_9RHOB|nr:DUF1344 domain-containing protein [Defluviimonas aquaemixtae]SPH16841.1 hypothetical protein DEA8626_00355 [Defluviimonas aquaemixtae]